MRPVGRGRWPVLILFGLVLLARGEFALTSALGDRAQVPIWDNPQTLGFDEINSLVSVAALFTQPVHDIARQLQAPPRVVGLVAPVCAPARPGDALATGPVRAPPPA